MRSEKLFRPFIRPMFNSHCGGIRLDEVSLMKRIGALLLCGILLLPAAGASAPLAGLAPRRWPGDGKSRSAGISGLAGTAFDPRSGGPGCSMSRQGSPLRMRSALSLMCLKRMPQPWAGQQGRAISLAWEMEPMRQAALSPGRNLPLSSGDRREHPRYRSKDSSVLGTPALCRNGRGMLCSGASRPG